MTDENPILSAWRSALRPGDHLTPSQWVSGRVKVMDGLTPEYDISSTPWFRDPMDHLANPSTHEIIIYAPIGTGKTVSLLEAGLAWVIAEDPGPTLLIWHTDDDLKDWSETRLDYCLSNTQETARLYPRDRHKANKMKILFPHMPLFMTGANMSGLQSKSMRRIVCDEVWRWKRGMLREAFGRLHDRWNRQAILVSQGGFDGDDMDVRAKDANMHEFQFVCPCCGPGQPWKQVNLRYDTIANEDGTLDRIASAETATYHCDKPGCKWFLTDSATARREIAEAAKYVKVWDGVPGRAAYRYNILANWRVPFSTVALEWITAQEHKKAGNLETFRQYVQKRLAENWKEDVFDEVQEMQSAGYLLSDYMTGAEWPGEVQRNMTIDVQMDHYWVRIRAVKPDGASRLLWCGKVNTKEMLRELQERFKVPAKLTFVDCGHDPGKVYDICAEYDWTALRGEGDKEYNHPTKDGSKVTKLYSPIQRALSPSSRKPVRVIFFSANKVKDILFRLKTGKGVAFEVGDDTPREWYEQMSSEKKVEEFVGKSKTQEFIWKRIGSRHNHLWDCEVMGIIPMMIFGLLGGE